MLLVFVIITSMKCNGYCTIREYIQLVPLFWLYVGGGDAAIEIAGLAYQKRKKLADYAEIWNLQYGVVKKYYETIKKYGKKY